jgi:hypothetical protein
MNVEARTGKIAKKERKCNSALKQENERARNKKYH